MNLSTRRQRTTNALPNFFRADGIIPIILFCCWWWCTTTFFVTTQAFHIPNGATTGTARRTQHCTNKQPSHCTWQRYSTTTTSLFSTSQEKDTEKERKMSRINRNETLTLEEEEEEATDHDSENQNADTDANATILLRDKKPAKEDPLQSSNLVANADAIAQVQGETTESSTPTSRRMLLATGLFSVGAATAALGTRSTLDSFRNTDKKNKRPTTDPTFTDSSLRYEVTPINKRTGVTVYDAEKAGYNVRFVTYLSRFLLNFDADCQRWWYARAQDLSRRWTATADEITQQRLQQFAAFAASVEVGLQAYEGPNGPAQLLQSLTERYGPETPSASLTGAAREKQERAIKEARRQIALLFGLMETNQPVQEITRLLAAIDNGHIGRVDIVDPGSGYAPGYGSPQVVFPPPDGGDSYEQATGRAYLEPNGRILRIDVVNRGAGYKNPPTVTVAPPAVLRFPESNVTDPIEAQGAQAKAYLFRSGPNKGRIERIELTNPGAGYKKSEIIKVRIASPETEGGVVATATAVLEYQVAGIEMINNGTGYAVEKPIEVYVEPPPLTARVNMNDPLMARLVDPSKPLPATTIPSPQMLKKMPDPAEFAKKISQEANRAACIGRGCYDQPVRAVAYPVAQKDSYSEFRTEDDAEKAKDFELALNEGQDKSNTEGRVVSASTSGSRPPDLPSLGIASPISSSTQLLSLLPAGVGLEFDKTQKRYVLAIDPTYGDDGAIQSWRSYKDFDPDFGPRGRTPIEKDMDLGVGTYLRFVASGAICCSAVHLALTPIDVVKTKVQTDPGMRKTNLPCQCYIITLLLTLSLPSFQKLNTLVLSLVSSMFWKRVA